MSRKYVALRNPSGSAQGLCLASRSVVRAGPRPWTSPCQTPKIGHHSQSSPHHRATTLRASGTRKRRVSGAHHRRRSPASRPRCRRGSATHLADPRPPRRGANSHRCSRGSAASLRRHVALPSIRFSAARISQRAAGHGPPGSYHVAGSQSWQIGSSRRRPGTDHRGARWSLARLHRRQRARTDVPGLPREAAKYSRDRRRHGRWRRDGSFHRRICRTGAVDQRASPGSCSITLAQEPVRDRAAPACSASHTLRFRSASCWSAGFVARRRSASGHASAFPRARRGARSFRRYDPVAHSRFHRGRHP